MNDLITILTNNPDAPVTFLLLIWTIIQVSKIKAQVATMQNDVDHLLRAIILTKLAKDEIIHNRHKSKADQSGIGQKEQT